MGRTLLSDAFDLFFAVGLDSANKNRINAKSVGQECPTHAGLACSKFPQVRPPNAFSQRRHHGNKSVSKSVYRWGDVMQNAWGSFWQRSRKPLKTGWLITVGLMSVYIGVIAPREEARDIADERATGLSASTGGWEPASLWKDMSLERRVHGVVGGVPGTVAEEETPLQASVTGGSAGGPPQNMRMVAKVAATDDDRKTIRTGAVDLVVKNPRETSEKIRQLTEQFGGFLVTSDVYGGDEASCASLTVRVPAARLEDARTEIRKLGLRVENEKLEAEDVTKQYVDQSARLRNLQAQETQYLGILKQAKTVKDTLDVSDKLNDVRGEIEQQQAEFDALSKQVETVALTITLRAEADMKVFGLNWRPLYQLKFAARQGLDSVGDYAAAMAAFVFYVPTILLWLATILICAAGGWRILRWAGKALFVARAKAA